MTFYDFEGNSITVQEFIALYEPCYFIGNSKAKGFVHTQSSSYVENQEIMPILQGHISSYSDLAKVMAWKIGKIKHLESEKTKVMQYASDWAHCESENPLRYGRVMELQKLADYILKHQPELEDDAINNPQECLCRLRDVGTKGIGTVYLITLLFFLSHGMYPIYDRFAMASLMAAEEDMSPHLEKTIKVPNLPSKGAKGFSAICKNQYADYIKRLEDLNVDYQNDRGLDRALWVYGHGFI